MYDDSVWISKLLALALRHKPERLGITLDAHGWTNVKTLLRQMQSRNVSITRHKLDEIVAHNDKQRFEFSPDGKWLRACQGHSLGIDLGLEPICPPRILYHGTAKHLLKSIAETGILAQSRDYVHLSGDIETARLIGARHGQPTVLRILANEMYIEDYVFYMTSNGVYLTHHVPTCFIERYDL